MQKLSDKVTGSELLATQWVNHSKEKENVVTTTGRVLSSSDTQLAESIDDYAKSNYYEAINKGSNKYVVSARRITINQTPKDKQIFNIKFDVANTGSVTLDLGDGAKDLKNSDGTALKANQIKSGDVKNLVFISNVFYFTTKATIKDISKEIENFIIESGLTINGATTNQLIEAEKLLSKKNNIKLIIDEAGLTYDSSDDTQIIKALKLLAKRDTIKKLIENAGLTYDVNNDNQVSEVVDIFAKSNVYSAVQVGGVYTANRVISPNILQSGMVNFIEFNSANSGAVNLNLDGTSRNLYNSNGSELQSNMILAGDIIPIYFDGTNFKSINRLWFKFNANNEWSYINSGISNIMSYFSFSNDLGNNARNVSYYMRGTKHEKNMNVDLTFIVTTDGFSSETGTNSSPSTFNINKLLKDKTPYNGKIIAINSNNGIITPFDGNTTHIYATLNTSIYNDGHALDGKIAFTLGNSPWKGENKTYKKWLIYLRLSFMVRD